MPQLFDQGDDVFNMMMPSDDVERGGAARATI